ncbi:MAG: hypothetical protein KF779_10965 [Hyphomonadaceae bacterium]|nr:hypothetical protein [Hyphomonadaceae bacterium]
MMRIGVSLLALGLMACSPPASETPATSTAEIPAASTPGRLGCDANASRDWSAVGSQYYIIETEAHGATCGEAIATIRIKSTEGQVLFTHDYPTRDVALAFNPNSAQTGLREEIDSWAQNASETGSAAELPAWPAGAHAPPGFQPAVTRNVYEQARGNQSALFCYPDGVESNACVAVAGTHATLLGSKTPERP